MSDDKLIKKYEKDLWRAQKNVDAIQTQIMQSQSALENLPKSSSEYLREKYQDDLTRLGRTLKKWQAIAREVADVLQKYKPALPLGKGGK